MPSLQSREPDPDRLFMLAWADNLMENARERLRLEYEQSGRFANRLREVIAETVHSPEEPDLELRELLSLLSQR